MVLRSRPEFSGFAVTGASSFGKEGLCKISNPKHQITNKSQIPILVLRTPHPAGGSPVSMTKTKDRFGILVIVICLIFVIWNFWYLIVPAYCR
jgi:hypothetical protein